MAFNKTIRLASQSFKTGGGFGSGRDVQLENGRQPGAGVQILVAYQGPALGVEHLPQGAGLHMNTIGRGHFLDQAGACLGAHYHRRMFYGFPLNLWLQRSPTDKSALFRGVVRAAQTSTQAEKMQVLVAAERLKGEVFRSSVFFVRPSAAPPKPPPEAEALHLIQIHAPLGQHPVNKLFPGIVPRKKGRW